jgi:hypothetical protein
MPASSSKRAFTCGSIAEQGLGGGIIPMQNWYASLLASDPVTGLSGWAVTDIADLLKTGTSQRGTVLGPMAEVVGESLQHVAGDIAGVLQFGRTRSDVARTR